MRIYKMNCNSCGAPLDIDLDRLQAFCPYCGEKLLLELDQLDKIIKETETTKRAKMKEEHETQRLKMQYNETRNDWLRSILKPLIIGAGALLAIFLYFSFVMNMGSGTSESKKLHLERVEKLQELEIEIEQAITKGDYDLAEILVNRLYLADNWSSEETEAWNDKRANYLKIINERRNR